MSAENVVNQQTCFELVDKYMSRDLKEGEIGGLQNLINQYGAPEIQGLVVDLIVRAQKDIGEERKPLINRYLDSKENGLRIDKWMQKRIKEQGSRSPLSKTAQNMAFNILNSPEGNRDAIRALMEIADLLIN